MASKDRKQRSIARRLISLVILIQLISALGVVGVTLAYERHTRFQAFDVMLRGRADSLLAAVQDANDEADDIVLDRTNLQMPAGDLYEVKDGAGRVLGRSANWNPALGRVAAQSNDGIFRAKIGGTSYRLLRRHGVRVVDPDEARGGTAHTVVVLYGAPTRGVWKEIRQAVVFYATASCVLLIFTGFLVFWVLRRGLLPLRELAAEAEGISAHQWSFSPPASARSTTELAPLALALESAVQRLALSFEQQRHFVGDAAHELKTAVAVLKSSLQLLTMRPRSAAEYEAGLYRSLADCERMEEIVAKMLTLARVESLSGRGAIDRSVDLVPWAREAATQLRPFADLRQVTVEMVSAESAWVGLSVEECTLLCSNLLMNALQHSRRSGEVTMSVEPAGENWVELRVEDHGRGIDAESLPHVFERFYRGDPSRARKTGGTGLGLAICRAITEQAGGRIHLESTPGVGTVAIVRLPSVQRSIGPETRVPLEAGVSSA